MKRGTRFILTIVVVVIVAAVVAGIIYEQLGRRQDKKRLAQIGQSVDIGGRTLNLNCSGEGSPAVILEGEIGYGWISVQPQIAKFTRVCSYDHAGFGWSDTDSSPRTSAAMASDLHELLRAAAIPPPYVLVGASFGGFAVRVFAGKYKDEVAGVVLVDSAHEDQHEPASMLALANRLPAPVKSGLCALLPTAGRVGLVRLMLSRSGERRGDSPPAAQGMTPDQANYFQSLSNLPNAFVASGNESCHWEQSAVEARAAGNLGDRPLIVLTAGRGFNSDDSAESKEAAAFHEVWVHKLQPQLARLSTRGRQVIVANSDHGIQFEAPEAVVAAVREVVTDIRIEQKPAR